MKSVAYLAAVAVVGGTAFFTSTPATAASASASRCDDPRIDTAACKREKAAVAAEKRQGTLNTQGEEQYRANALRRCERQPEGAARESCRERVLGKGDTTVTGSVEGGGQLRRNEIVVPDAPKR